MKRCHWAGDDPQMIAYHDCEWGVPLHDDRALFELLILEGAQAGLSWSTILRKRDNYREAFDGFDAAKIARYNQRRIDRLMADAGIVRNRLKIESTIQNARSFLEIQQQSGGFHSYIWSFVDGRPIRNRLRGQGDIQATSKESDAMSKDLKRRGFRFVGSTICYAFMQSAGLVNDHLVSCFRYAEVNGNSASSL
jgi:DNA-3-methyladenine glycosylase I